MFQTSKDPCCSSLQGPAKVPKQQPYLTGTLHATLYHLGHVAQVAQQLAQQPGLAAELCLSPAPSKLAAFQTTQLMGWSNTPK